jgi:N-acetylglutamate synthase-like GNAT family acetyltransferase
MMSNSVINIIPYQEELAVHFKELNIAWLEKYFVVEPIDTEMLNDPKSYFLDKGGFIYFATINNEVAGTFALLRNTDKVYELSKMAVSDKFQGQKIGNKMMEFCVQKATELKVGKLLLYSNTILEPAIHLYKKYGFTEVVVSNSDYKRANIKMELVIQD